MDIIKSFLDSDSSLVDAVASKIGLEKDQISKLVEGLVPELNKGVQEKISGGASGIQSLMDGLDLSSLAKLVGGSADVEDGEANSMGQVLLKNILGGEQGLESTVTKLTESTGISVDAVQEAIPSITTAFMNFFSKNGEGLSNVLQGLTLGLGEGSSSMLDSVTGLLDKDGDGQVVDDLLDAAKKLF